jgi:GMP reductase
MKIEQDVKLDFKDVLIRPKRSNVHSRSCVDLEREFHFRHSHIIWKGIPIIAANMDTTGTLEVYETLSKHNIVTALHKFYSLQDLLDYKSNSEKILDPNFFMISTGIGESDFERLVAIFTHIDCNWICIDIANGYLDVLITFCRRIRAQFPDKIIIAGNVVTREIVEDLILAGVDIIKAGIGGGSACTTRLKTGVGMPQVSTILECADAAHGLGGHIISDGGITCPGDMAKAFGSGADFVMVGGQFAGHDQNPGEIIEDDGKKFKLFYGMSSSKAQETHYGKMNSYRSSEGRVMKIPYKGDLNVTVLDYLGGIRSACTYVNAASIEELARRTTFIRVTQQMNTFFVSPNH